MMGTKGSKDKNEIRNGKMKTGTKKDRAAVKPKDKRSVQTGTATPKGENGGK